MSEEKTILLKVTLDTADLKKSSDEASKALESLKVKQSILKTQNAQGTVEYAKLSAEIRMQTKVLNDTAKALVINEKLNKENKGSINEMREALASGTTAYNKLSKEQRENSDIGRQLQKDNKALSDGLKEQEGAIGDTRRNVGNYNTSLADLKKELKALKGEMVGLDAGSEKYQQASEKAGKLGDKIKEVNENVKASSGGSGFEKMSNNLGLIKNDLVSMDFAGVSEKMKQMAVISKGMTFKETLGGMKDMGKGLLSLGKAILMNPMFLMVGAIVAVVGALKMWSDYTSEQAVKAQDKHTKSLENNIKAIQEKQKWIEKVSELELKKAELEGKNEEEKGKIRLKLLIDSNNNQLKESERYQLLANNLQKRANEASDKDKKADFETKASEAQEQSIQLFNDALLFEDRKKVLILENQQLIREETKSNNDKIRSENEKAENERLAFLTKINELILSNEELSNENRYKVIEANYNAKKLLAEMSISDLLDLEETKNIQLDELDNEAKQDALSRRESEYKQELKDAKNNSKLITEIDERNALLKSAIDFEYRNKKKERDAKSKKDFEENGKIEIETVRNTKNEILQIDSELNILKAVTEQEQLKAFKEGQDVRISILKSNAEHEIEIGKDKNLILKKLEGDTAKVQNETFTAKKEKIVETNDFELTEDEKKIQKQTVSALNGANQLAGALAQIQQNQLANELIGEQNKNDEKQAQLQQQLDNGLITNAEFLGKKSQLDSEYKAKESKIKKEQFEKDKQANIIKSIINTAVGVTAAIPDPALMILSATLGAIETGLIASQPTPKFAKGGTFGGASHSNGGTKGVFSDGTQIEVEKDENFYIVNKHASRYINGLSNINQSIGGGVPLMASGGAVTSSGIIAGSISGNVDSQLNSQNQMLRMIQMMPKPIVLVQDINDAQGNLSSVENRANF